MKKIKILVVLVVCFLFCFSFFMLPARADEPIISKSKQEQGESQSEAEEGEEQGLEITVAPMIMHRAKNDDFNIVTDLGGNGLLNAEDYDFGYQARPDVSIAYNFSDKLKAEARFYGIYDWEDTTAAIPVPGGTALIPYETPLTVVAPGMNLSSSYDSSLHSVEASLRWYPVKRIGISFGGRYFKIKEALSMLLDAGGGNMIVCDNQASNVLRGPQLGIDAVIYESKDKKWGIDGWVKAGYYFNSAENRVLITQLPAPGPIFGSAGRDDIGTAGIECGLNGNYSLNKNISLFAGYQFLWFNDIATAPGQIPVSNLISGAASIGKSDVTYQGFRVGAKLAWPAPPYTQESQSLAQAADPAETEETAEPKKHTFEIGNETSYIEYEEPSVMKDKGMMYGVVADYTYRGWLAPALEELDRFILKLETKNSWGTVDYTSPMSGTLDDIPDYMLEVRGLLGYDFNVANSVLTPYLGFGYRYLNDDSSGMTASTGAAGYEREANYLYIPFGAEFTTNLNNSWSIGATAEYDLFFWGRQYSHMEDFITGFNTLENEQKKGYGVRGSIKLVKKGGKFNFVIEPFAKYWYIRRSKDAIITLLGVPVGIGYEPKNNSREFGGRFALEF